MDALLQATGEERDNMVKGRRVALPWELQEEDLGGGEDWAFHIPSPRLPALTLRHGSEQLRRARQGQGFGQTRVSSSSRQHTQLFCPWVSILEGRLQSRQGCCEWGFGDSQPSLTLQAHCL